MGKNSVPDVRKMKRTQETNLKIRNRSRHWLFMSICGMHALGWYGLYRFLSTFLETNRQVAYAGAGVVVIFVISCIMRWREVFFPIAYTTKWYLLVEIFALYLYGLYRQDMDLRMDMLFAGMVCIIGHFWCLYLQGVWEYFNQGRGWQQADAPRSLSINHHIVAVLLAALFVCLILTELFQFDQLLTELGNMIGRFSLAVIRFVLGVVHFLKQLFQPGASDLPEDLGTSPSHPVQYSDVTGVPYLIGITAFGLAMLLIFIVMIKQAELKPEEQQGERPEFHTHGSIEDEVKTVDEEKLTRIPFLRNNREKIRYRFKRRVKKHYRKWVPIGHTAWQFNRELGREQVQDSEQEALDRLTVLYDIARYSNRELSDQEIRGVK